MLPFLSDSFGYHLSISFFLHKSLEPFYERVMLLVFHQYSAVLIDQLRCRSFSVTENRYSEKQRFNGSDSIAFLRQVDQAFCLADDLDFLIHILDPTDEDDRRSGDGFKSLFIGSAAHHDERDVEFVA